LDNNKNGDLFLCSQDSFSLVKPGKAPRPAKLPTNDIQKVVEKNKGKVI
jgi:hypothetical protein